MAYELIFQAWAPVASLVLLISLILISFFYMIGRALDNDGLRKWAQNEIYQVFASAFLLGSAVLMISIVNNMMYGIISVMNPAINLSCGADYCTFNKIEFQSYGLITESPENMVASTKIIQVSCGGENLPCHIVIAITQLEHAYDVIRYYLANKIVSAGWVDLLAGASIGYSKFKATPLAVLSNISSIYSNFIQIGFNMLILLKANSMFLSFASAALFPALIISGLVLRSISLFRGLGGLLFSIAIGAYFIYPMLIIFSMTLISPDPAAFISAFSDNSQFITAEASVLSDVAASAGTGGVVVVSENTAVSDTSWGSSVLTFSKDLLTKYLWVNTGSDSKVDRISYHLFRTIMPQGFLDNLAFISVWVFVPFIVSIYGLLAFIKEFAQFVSGDAKIMGLSRLI
mgnify:CR=1 FL=1